MRLSELLMKEGQSFWSSLFLIKFWMAPSKPVPSDYFVVISQVAPNPLKFCMSISISLPLRKRHMQSILALKDWNSTLFGDRQRERKGEGWIWCNFVHIFLHSWKKKTRTFFNPFTPESDQCQNSPAASQEIWHHTVWRTWLFIAYSDEKWLYYKFSLHHSYNHFLKGWENTLFELRSERVKTQRVDMPNVSRFWATLKIAMK